MYGLGRIGKVHAAIVQEQGHEIVAVGDDEQAAVVAAQEELNVGAVKTFNDPTRMAHEMAGVIDAVIIASHTMNHAKDALPFVQARIPIYLEKPLTDDLQELRFCRNDWAESAPNSNRSAASIRSGAAAYEEANSIRRDWRDQGNPMCPSRPIPTSANL